MKNYNNDNPINVSKKPVRDYEIIIDKNNLIKDEEIPKDLVVVGKMKSPTIPIDNETDDILLEKNSILFLVL